MFKIVTITRAFPNAANVPDDVQRVEDAAALMVLATELATFTTGRAADPETSMWHLGEVEESKYYFILVSGQRDHFLEPDFQTLRFDCADDPELFCTLFKMVFYYAAATANYDPRLSELLMMSPYVTGPLPT